MGRVLGRAAVSSPLVLSLFPGRGDILISMSNRVCPLCDGPKAFYANSCRACSPPQKPLLGKKGAAHPAWRGGREIDRDGYVRLYAPDHPWPRRNGYVLEHVAVMELHLGRRITTTETVHHKDENRQHNKLGNLELMRRGAHSRLHRLQDTHRRRRVHGRFA